MGASDHGLDDDVWELYNVEEDWTQSNDLAAEHPEKLAELQRLFLIQAARFNVLPLDIRSAERFNPDIAGRPALSRGTTQTLYPGMKRLSENSVINIKNKSFTVDGRVTVPDGGADGVLIAQGGAYGGWSLYAHDGELRFAYNLLGIKLDIVAVGRPLPRRRARGARPLRATTAAASARAARSRCSPATTRSARAGSSGRSRSSSPSTRPSMSAATSPRPCRPTTARAATSSRRPRRVRIDLGDDDHSHLIDDEHRLRSR